MPNWCYIQVCFKGSKDNIKRLIHDIECASEFNKKYGRRWCNIRYFLSLSNFDTVSYLETNNKTTYDCNFRGNIYSYSHTVYTDDEENMYYHPIIELAWDNDYHLIQLISILYNVEYSAYSEEEGMGIYSKCKNSDNISAYDFDFCIRPDSEQLENALEENPELDIDYSIPIKIGDDIKCITNNLFDHNIEYDIYEVEKIEPPDIYGVYYKYIFGIDYDYEKQKLVYGRYPGIDRFNM